MKRRRTKAQKPDSDAAASKARAGSESDGAEEIEETRPAPGTLMRTRRLLLAALRVWELKNGIHSRPFHYRDGDWEDLEPGQS